MDVPDLDTSISRESVFAETALQRVEDRISNWKEYKREQLCHWSLHGRRSFGQSRVGPEISLDDLLSQLKRELQDLQRQRDYLLNGGLADRVKRRMTSLKRIAEYHGLSEPPCCAKCKRRAPVETWREASGWLERAHIIDRIMDGLDTEANIAPLCGLCHRMQPIFYPGDEITALKWFGLARTYYAFTAMPVVESPEPHPYENESQASA